MSAGLVDAPWREESNTASSSIQASRHLNPPSKPAQYDPGGKEEDNKSEGQLDEELLDGLDDDFELAGIRERRLEELKAEVLRQQEMRANNHGRLTEVKVEKDLVHILAKSKASVIHFFHEDFRRCKMMDEHLEIIAARHFNTRFLRVNVANAPFMVEKLGLKVLPCVITCVDGVTRDKIIGFEGLGENDSDSFPTSALELRLRQSGVIGARETNTGISRPIFGGVSSQAAGADNDDWDE